MSNDSRPRDRRPPRPASRRTPEPAALHAHFVGGLAEGTMPHPPRWNDMPDTTIDRAEDPQVPATSILFGYGPMLPLVLAGAAAWILPWPGSHYAVQALILWGALILVFIAGVRRGFGFGSPRASTAVEIATMMAYFLLALAAIVVPRLSAGLALLILGYALVALLDRQAALHGNAPAHFARLRPPQMLVGIVGLAAALARTLP